MTGVDSAFDMQKRLREQFPDQKKGSFGYTLPSFKNPQDKNKLVIEKSINLLQVDLLLGLKNIASMWSETAQNYNYSQNQDNKKIPDLTILRQISEQFDSSLQAMECEKVEGIVNHAPCLVTLLSGQVLSLWEIIDSEAIILSPKGEFKRFPLKDIKKEYAGVIFKLHPNKTTNAPNDIKSSLNREFIESQKNSQNKNGLSLQRQKLGKISPNTIQQNEINTPSAEHGFIENEYDELIDHKNGLYRFLISISLRKHPVLVTQLLLSAGVSNVLTLALPIFIMLVYDRVVPHNASATLITLSIGFLIILGIDLTMRYIRTNLNEALSLPISVRLQAKLFHHITHSELSKTPRHPGGLSDISREIEGMSQSIPSILTALFIDLPFVLFVLLLIYVLAGYAVFGALLGVIAIAALTIISTQLAKSRLQKEVELNRKKTNLITETISTVEAIKAGNAEDRLSNSWAELTDNHAMQSHHAKFFSQFSSQATAVISQFSIMASVFLGVLFISSGNMSMGNLAATILLVGRVIGPITMIVTSFNRAITVSHSLKRLEKILSLPQEKAGDDRGRHLPNKPAIIRFQNVSFSYPQSAHDSFKGFNLTINAGEKIGIIGRNGSGKSTLLKMIPRLLSPQEGMITLAEHNIQQYNPKDIRKTIAYMSQDTVLFDQSIRDNLLLSNQNVSEDEIDKICRITGLHEISSSLPNGLGLEVGPRGERLSGGERQIVCLTRTLLSGATTFLLDEPTSSLDNTAEAAFVSQSSQWFKDKTLILSTHRMHLLTLVNRIILLDKGRIIADGPRDQVLERLNAA